MYVRPDTFGRLSIRHRLRRRRRHPTHRHIILYIIAAIFNNN